MKHPPLNLILVLLLFVPSCRAQEAPQSQQAKSLPPIEVFFSPKGGCTEAVVKEINAAKTTILVQAYSFTSTPIAKALVDAHKRGVKVEVILDKSQRTEKYSVGGLPGEHAGSRPGSTPSTPSPTTRSWSSTERRSSPARSISPSRPKHHNAENLWSSETRHWPTNTPPTGKPTPIIPSVSGEGAGLFRDAPSRPRRGQQPHRSH